MRATGSPRSSTPAITRPNSSNELGLTNEPPRRRAAVFPLLRWRRLKFCANHGESWFERVCGMSAILEMRGISKSFPGVKALRDVNLAVEEGEIHAICGENGAGKSTLMKVLSGVYPHGSYEGEIVYQGAEQRCARIDYSEHLGIIIIHQELALVPLLSIAENIFLGNEPAKYGVIDWHEAFSRTRELLAKVGLKESPNALITNLGVGKQQLVEIAKPLAKKLKLLILPQ